MRRILVAGCPRVGKTTLADHLAAALGVAARHTDDLIASHDWSGASEEAARWISEPGPWIVEGVAAVRALRKWLVANPAGLPCDALFWSETPRVALTKGQFAMGKGCVTVWEEIRDRVYARGVAVRRF